MLSFFPQQIYEIQKIIVSQDFKYTVFYMAQPSFYIIYYSYL